MFPSNDSCSKHVTGDLLLNSEKVDTFFCLHLFADNEVLLCDNYIESSIVLELNVSLLN